MAKITKEFISNDETTNDLWSTNNGIETQQVSNNDLFQLVQSLQAKVKELEWGTSEKVKKSKEKYQWPLKASYWLRAGVPIISYKSVKKEEAFDWLYKDWDGKRIDNHYIEPELITGEKVKKVLRNTFDTSVQKSELTEFDVIDERWNTIKNATARDLLGRKVAFYVFNTTWYGEIKVLPSCVN